MRLTSSTTAYDPHEHADELGLVVEYQNLRTNFGLYIPSSGLILLRKRMKAATERSVLAHEVQHHVHGHRRTAGVWALRQERVADAAAARALISPDKFQEAIAWSKDPREWAIDLQVTGDIVVAYLKGLEAA